MSMDITRDRFDPAKQYSRVVMQQGRVLLDSDWNEQQSILLHYMRSFVRDIIGPYGGPERNLGFEVITAADANWQERLKELHCEAFESDLKSGKILLGAGRYYVHGVPVENAAPKSFAINVQSGPTLIYLQVWESDVTYLQDDGIREVALGGIDTCGRTKVLFRVQSRVDGNVDCSYVETLPQLGAGTLSAQARPASAPSGPCVIPPDARYSGAENNLYRVQIHQGGEANGAFDGATFKWDRDNARQRFSIRSFADGAVEVETLGRDLRFGLEAGNTVELRNDRTEADCASGLLCEVVEVRSDSLMVTLKPAADRSSHMADFAADGIAAHPFLARWAFKGDGGFSGALPAIAGDWIDLENGIQIQFCKGASYRAGDYWFVPARTTGDIEWPVDAASGVPIAAALPPHGPRFYYAPLKLIGGGGSTPGATKDCRCKIASLPCVAQDPRDIPKQIDASPELQPSDVRRDALVPGAVSQP